MLNVVRLLVIGGSDAGISAGLRAREVCPAAEVTIVVADAYPNFSVCGLPFYVSGETPAWESLAHRTLGDLEAAGLSILLNHTATAIDADGHQVHVVNAEHHERWLSYDKLVIATGAQPVLAHDEWLQLDGVCPLHTMSDALRIHEHLDARAVRKVAIVGTGYIGLEMADAPRHRDLDVTLFGRARTVLPSVDSALGEAIEEELHRNGVDVTR